MDRLLAGAWESSEGGGDKLELPVVCLSLAYGTGVPDLVLVGTLRFDLGAEAHELPMIPNKPHTLGTVLRSGRSSGRPRGLVSLAPHHPEPTQEDGSADPREALARGKRVADPEFRPLHCKTTSHTRVQQRGEASEAEEGQACPRWEDFALGLGRAGLREPAKLWWWGRGCVEGEGGRAATADGRRAAGHGKGAARARSGRGGDRVPVYGSVDKWSGTVRGGASVVHGACVNVRPARRDSGGWTLGEARACLLTDSTLGQRV